MKIFTIGVYNSSETHFFDKLKNNHIDVFCDIRQRRGVRGRKYAFVNSLYLQKRLEDMGIRYLYEPALAPTKEIREKQKEEDARLGEHKRDREQLGCTFIDEYRKNIVCNFDFGSFVERLKDMDANNVILLCVEEKAKACHRSIVAEEIQQRYGYEVIHL